MLYCLIVIKQKKFFYLLSPISYLILSTIILTALLFPALKVRVFTSSSYEVASVAERARGFNEGWEIFKTNRWLGVGAGNYTAYLQKIDPTRLPWEYQPAHNVGLLFLAESGVVGAVLLLLVIISFIIYHLSLVRNQESGIRNQEIQTDARQRWKIIVVFCYLGFVFCYLILAFLDHYLISSYTGLVLTGIFWGLVFKSAREVVPNSSTAG